MLSENTNTNFKKSYKWLSWVVVIVGFFVVLSILSPHVVTTLLNILWVLLFAMVIIFFWLGALVVMGMKKEVSGVLDVLLEGSLTIIDFLNLLRKLWKKFVQTLREFVLFATSIFSIILVTLVYILLILLFKLVGLHYDVTPIAIIITIVLVVISGVLNNPREVTTLHPNTWFSRFILKLQSSFSDAFEIMIFVFFLTMDSTRLPFLPAEYNVALKSQLGGYDLMLRGFTPDAWIGVTIKLILVAITSESVRNVLRIIAVSKVYYAEALASADTSQEYTRMQLVKDSIRNGFGHSKDDVLKFITFTTVLITVFLIFPRLKLLTLGVASVTSLAMDLVVPRRLSTTKGTDLISRILTKIFKL